LKIGIGISPFCGAGFWPKAINGTRVARISLKNFIISVKHARCWPKANCFVFLTLVQSPLVKIAIVSIFGHSVAKIVV
jgi:hypothetical protein